MNSRVFKKIQGKSLKKVSWFVALVTDVTISVWKIFLLEEFGIFTAVVIMTNCD